MAPLTPTVINMRVQYSSLVSLLRLLTDCICLLLCMAWSKNLSCVKVNSMIWMVKSKLGISGPFCSYAVPWTTMCGLSFARHSQCVVLHVQVSLHGGMVLFWGLPC